MDTAQDTFDLSSFNPLGVDAADPYPFLRHAREHEPVFFSAALGAWCVTRYDDIIEVVTDAGRAALVEAAAIHRRSLDYLRSLIDDRVASPRDDLISFFIHNEVKGQRLTYDEVASQLFSMLAAGTDTTGNALCNTLRALLEQPARWADLVAGRTPLGDVVNEGLRYNTRCLACSAAPPATPNSAVRRSPPDRWCSCCSPRPATTRRDMTIQANSTAAAPASPSTWPSASA